MAGGTGTRESGAGGEADIGRVGPDFGFVPGAEIRGPDAHFCYPTKAETENLRIVGPKVIPSGQSVVIDLLISTE